MLDLRGQGLCNDQAPTPVTTAHRILVLNWRDIAHPRAGGAEKVTHEIARRWVQWGHEVTVFSGLFPGGRSTEVIDGVTFVRRGHQHTVHWEAYRYYRAAARGRYDVVIDEVNTIPFFTPLYVREPILMFSHQLAREVWHYQARFPLSAMGYLAEPLYMQVYRRTPLMTVSESTKRDLRRLGLSGPCHIIPEAVDTEAVDVLPQLTTKEDRPTVIFVGRVVPAKRVDHLIDALGVMHRDGLGDAHLWIVGPCDQEYRSILERRALKENVRGSVTFFGGVDSATKEALLARAHICVMTSIREGWGLVVTEANRLGTPAVVYDVPGLRDSTLHGKTGLVCSVNTPADLACQVSLLYRDQALYASLRENAWAEAKALSWGRTAEAAWAAVAACL